MLFYLNYCSLFCRLRLLERFCSSKFWSYFCNECFNNHNFFIAVGLFYYQLLIMILLIWYFIRPWMFVVTYQIFSFFPGWGWKVETSSIMEEKVSDQGQESWERGWGGAERDRGSDPTVPPTQSQAGRGGQLNAPPHHRTHDELLTNHRMRDEPLTGSIQDCSTNRQRLCVRIDNLWTNYVL